MGYTKGMKLFLALLLLAGIAYGGYIFYRQSARRAPISLSNVSLPATAVIAQSGDAWSQIANVLGESVSRAVSVGTNVINQVTGGEGGPIVNQALSNLQNQVKDLPAKEAAQIQYNYCKTVVSDYEGAKKDSP